jgi:hypothetical protein
MLQNWARRKTNVDISPSNATVFWSGWICAWGGDGSGYISGAIDDRSSAAREMGHTGGHKPRF